MKPKPKSIEYCINYTSDKPYFNNFLNNIIHGEPFTSINPVNAPTMLFRWPKNQSGYWHNIHEELAINEIKLSSTFEDLQNYIFVKYPMDKYPEYYI